MCRRRNQNCLQVVLQFQTLNRLILKSRIYLNHLNKNKNEVIYIIWCYFLGYNTVAAAPIQSPIQNGAFVSDSNFQTVFGNTEAKGKIYYSPILLIICTDKRSLHLSFHFCVKFACFFCKLVVYFCLIV